MPPDATGTGNPSFSLYHATKWDIEGFVEPGPTGTNFGAGLVRAEPMAAYGATPAGDVRHAIADDSLAIKGDAGHSVNAMNTAADAEQTPFCLVLGSHGLHIYRQGADRATAQSRNRSARPHSRRTPTERITSAEKSPPGAEGKLTAPSIPG